MIMIVHLITSDCRYHVVMLAMQRMNKKMTSTTPELHPALHAHGITASVNTDQGLGFRNQLNEELIFVLLLTRKFELPKFHGIVSLVDIYNYMYSWCCRSI